MALAGDLLGDDVGESPGMSLFVDDPGDPGWAFGIGGPPVRVALVGLFGVATFSVVGGEQHAFTPASIACRSDVEGKFSTTFIGGGDDGDSSAGCSEIFSNDCQ